MKNVNIKNQLISAINDISEDKLLKIFNSLKSELPFDFRSIKTFEDAYERLGIDPDDVFHKNDSIDEIAFKKLKVIIKVINNGWTPDWNNNNQPKYYPYFQMSGRFGFSGASCSYVFTGAYGGSRLCLESKEKTEYVGKTFESLYKEFLA